MRNITPLFLTFVIESVYPVDVGTLMISSKKEEVLWIFDLIGQEKADGLHGLLSSVHIVPKKEVIGIWGKGAVLKQPEKVIVLAMNIT